MSSRDNVPFFLREAVISLYPAGADGTSLTGLAVWSGALANQLQLREALEEMKIAGSGDTYATAKHIDEEHLIEIGRTWILRKQFLQDFRPARNQQYVMEIVWSTDGVWYKRTYFGVTGRVVTTESRGTNQFLVGQTFRAQSLAESNGVTGAPIIYTPTPTTEQSIAFFREDPFVIGEYLLGHYRWGTTVVLNSVLVIGSAGQGAPTVLTLEINGVLTAVTVTIGAGLANVETTVSASLGAFTVLAGQSVRWQITSGPIPENAMWEAALTMQVSV